MFGDNPLLEDVTQAVPHLVTRARALATPPTMFTAGARPLFTASGIDPAMLARLPYVARHAAATAEGPLAAEIFEAFATNDVVAWYRAQVKFEKDQALHRYRTQVLDWLNTPHPDMYANSGPRSVVRLS